MTQSNDPPTVVGDPPAHRLTITVYGVPQPQGSKRHVGNGRMIESNQHALNAWREDVKLAALRALEVHPGWQRDYAVVTMHVAFTLPRPRGHYRTRNGEPSNLLHSWAPQLHGRKPDLDKLLRSTGDALTAAGVYTDDARVAQAFAVKSYTSFRSIPPGTLDRPGARIVLQGVTS